MLRWHNVNADKISRHPQAKIVSETTFFVLLWEVKITDIKVIIKNNCHFRALPTLQKSLPLVPSEIQEELGSYVSFEKILQHRYFLLNCL